MHGMILIANPLTGLHTIDHRGAIRLPAPPVPHGIAAAPSAADDATVVSPRPRRRAPTSPSSGCICRSRLATAGSPSPTSRPWRPRRRTTRLTTALPAHTRPLDESFSPPARDDQRTARPLTGHHGLRQPSTTHRHGGRQRRGDVEAVTVGLGICLLSGGNAALVGRTSVVVGRSPARRTTSWHWPGATTTAVPAPTPSSAHSPPPPAGNEARTRHPGSCWATASASGTSASRKRGSPSCAAPRVYSMEPFTMYTNVPK
jgi:hypothetical protein